MNTNFKELNHVQKSLELKKQKAILNLEADFNINDQYALLARAKEIISALDGEKFGPIELQNEYGIHEQALLIEGKRAGCVESAETRNLVPKQYVVHLYELSAKAKAGREVAALNKEIGYLLQENQELKAELDKLKKAKSRKKG